MFMTLTTEVFGLLDSKFAESLKSQSKTNLSYLPFYNKGMSGPFVLVKSTDSKIGTLITDTVDIPHSRKFSLVQNSTKLSPSPSEENFVVFNFAQALWRDHTHQ